MTDYKHLDKYICDQFYIVETKNHGTFKGFLLNYNWGNLVLLTVKGVVHLQYADLNFMTPIKPDEKLQEIIDEVVPKKEKNNTVKEIEEIKIIKPKESFLENKYHDKDYYDRFGNILRKVHDEHKIIISGKTQSNDDFSIEIAANGEEVGIKYNLP